VPIERILQAFIEPAILIEKSPEFVRLLGRIHAEGLMPEITRRHFQPLISRFLAALRRALPEMPQKELVWKTHFAIGAMANTLTARPETFPGAEEESPLIVSRMLVSFLSRGFTAQAADKETEVNQ
jgi:hypothetical protein